jgi:hypothetical protein
MPNPACLNPLSKPSEPDFRGWTRASNMVLQVELLKISKHGPWRLENCSSPHYWAHQSQRRGNRMISLQARLCPESDVVNASCKWRIIPRTIARMGCLNPQWYVNILQNTSRLSVLMA